jgi:hypothetical protein
VGGEDIGLPKDDLVCCNVDDLVVSCDVLCGVVALHYWNHSALLPLAHDIVEGCYSEVTEIAVQSDKKQEEKCKDHGETGANPVEYHCSQKLPPILLHPQHSY